LHTSKVHLGSNSTNMTAVRVLFVLHGISDLAGLEFLGRGRRHGFGLQDGQGGLLLGRDFGGFVLGGFFLGVGEKSKRPLAGSFWALCDS